MSERVGLSEDGAQAFLARLSGCITRALFSDDVEGPRVAEALLAGFREFERLRAENEALRKWQVAVADGLGFLNRPEGQDGYEVAPAARLLEEWRALETHATGASELEGELAGARAAQVAERDAWATKAEELDCARRGFENRLAVAESTIAARDARIAELEAQLDYASRVARGMEP